MSKTDKIEYCAKGVALLNLWGGGKGYYPTNTFCSKKSLTDLKKQIRDAVKDGSIDSGMGSESSDGALMRITTLTQKKIGGKIFSHEDYDFKRFGKVGGEQRAMSAFESFENH